MNAETTYLFYDIETTGLDKAFDQVLQFAAIRTDQELNELSREQFYVKLSPDVIPSPNAMIVHRISITDTQKGLSELDAIQKIHQLINQPGTVSCGYNTLGFDDEFLRFSFYRHLLSPYTHQYANQCSRMDLYPITVMYYLYHNSIIKWPDSQGKASLKLADINEANQLFLGSAHDAMVDVEVTLALAKRFIKSRKMWDYLLGCFNKNTDKKRLEVLVDHQGLLIDGKFGSDLCYQWPIIYLGEHTIYKNQRIFLRLDSELIQLTTEKNIAENTWVFRKKLGECGLLLPMQERHIEKLSAERRGLVCENLKWLKNNPEILKSIESHHKNYVYPIIENVDIDAALYINGFISNQDEQLCQKFHRVDVSEKLKIIELFEDKNLHARAIRLMGRYYRDYLPERYQEIFYNYMMQVWGHEHNQEPIVNYKGGERLTAQKGLLELNVLRENPALDTHQHTVLDELERYLI